MGCQKRKRNGKWSWGSRVSDGDGDSDDDGDLQEEDGQASKDEHEEVGNEKGSTAMLEAEKRKPPDISCIFTDIYNDQRYFLHIHRYSQRSKIFPAYSQILTTIKDTSCNIHNDQSFLCLLGYSLCHLSRQRIQGRIWRSHMGLSTVLQQGSSYYQQKKSE